VVRLLGMAMALGTAMFLGKHKQVLEILKLALPAVLQPWSANVQKLTCRALSDKLFKTPETQRTHLQTNIAWYGGFWLGTRGMWYHPADVEVQLECARFFCAMANFNRAASLIAGNSGAIEVLHEAMKRHPDHAILQGQASASMGCWCDWTPETEEKVAAAGAPKSILAALRRFPSDAQVQFYGWAGLSSVSNRIDSKRIIMAAGAMDFGMELMRHPELKKGFRVRQEILMTFANLVNHCEECATELMGHGDIIEQILLAMAEEVPDARRGTLTDGIQLMGYLTRTNRTTRAGVLKAGALEPTLAAAREFPKRHPQGAWPLGEFALELLNNLAEEKDAQSTLVKAGVPEVVRLLEAEEPHDNHRKHMGKALLSKLSAAS